MNDDVIPVRSPTRRDLVIDTNVVLDWLVFGHPIGAALSAALSSGHWRWIATAAMRDEMASVIGRESLSRWKISSERVWEAWRRHATPCDAARPLGPHERLRCTDPDDQKFVDLAVAHRVRALLTRDRAVLRLAPYARRLDIVIATPERWIALDLAPSASASRA